MEIERHPRYVPAAVDGVVEGGLGEEAGEPAEEGLPGGVHAAGDGDEVGDEEAVVGGILEDAAGVGEARPPLRLGPADELLHWGRVGLPLPPPPAPGHVRVGCLLFTSAAAGAPRGARRQGGDSGVPEELDEDPLGILRQQPSSQWNHPRRRRPASLTLPSETPLDLYSDPQPS